MKYFHKTLGELHDPDAKSIRLYESGKYKPKDHFFFRTAKGTAMPIHMEDVISQQTSISERVGWRYDRKDC